MGEEPQKEVEAITELAERHSREEQEAKVQRDKGVGLMRRWAQRVGLSEDVLAGWTVQVSSTPVRQSLVPVAPHDYAP